MKKIIVLAIVAVMVLSFGVLAFAETANESPDWYKEMIKWKKDQIEKAVEDKQITEEQAKYWNERIDAMEKYHNENGFNFPGGCGGPGRGQGRGFGGGFGQGMRGGFNRTNVTTNGI
ncbi:DUF2680 domain-containing protein [Wukongibacter baidiensis]|uniref:DUF2680 domain-containing protein n=1 Tax=Wukongibacter baidiensis TaxID=1723361 RepID=UPI003D7FA706